jgi:NAD(P)-dependent dehydrogenase (short-subunit alcohol dehydrogenase family)
MSQPPLKRALVTGATSGIGLAIAEALLGDGCFVHLNYAHDEERAKSVASRLAPFGNNFGFIRADLSEYGGISKIVAALRDGGTPLTYLVLNYGATDRAPFIEIAIEDWERVMRANVNVPFFITQVLHNASLFAPTASILCISSLMASVSHSVSVSYGVSKAAMSSMCQNLAKFLAPSDIRINAIEPGFIDTPWQKEKPADQRGRIESKTALGRFGEPEEVAVMCLAVLKNTYMTGAVVTISGGYGLV